jgi:hypothetical protein
MRTVFIVVTIALLQNCAPSFESKLPTPYAEAGHIEIFSFRDRSDTSSKSTGKEYGIMDLLNDTIYQIGDWKLNTKVIRDRIVLNKAQANELTDLLAADQCETDGGSTCYDPRHVIVFFDKRKAAFAYIEICFSCTNYETSHPIALDFCYEKATALEKLFANYGVKYFGRGESE